MDIADSIKINPATSTSAQSEVRRDIRHFLTETLAAMPPRAVRSWGEYSAEFSSRLGKAGWIGMTWPKRYGGRGRPMLERFVVLEELLAAGAPVSAHWVAERQCGPLLMRYATPALCEAILPGIARGEVFFCIGLSEPDSGSDLASIRTRADKVDGGWLINGAKIWTSLAAKAHFMSALVRTTPGLENRHAGLSQFVVDMRSEGLTVRTIKNMLGSDSFAEVVFDNVFVPDDNLLGQAGMGWEQVTAELTFERSGPDRYLSSISLLTEMLDHANAEDRHHTVELGRLVAELSNLRAMSRGIGHMLSEGKDPRLATSNVKDLGALLEQRTPEIAHQLFGTELRVAGSSLVRTQSHLTQAAVAFSVRGGTREILRGIVAKGLGLR
ncbi:acyl-CoA dehydrogenase family protein [Hydrogenophaga sp. 2FB]|uniref:acyl-CoA dehydrogenase family protein n=1 Tax=Hydrogenophaga sp. 2FB TaxID=2502187 RepID=UPI0010F46C54|nr:acyl-CoA dehydrogenase family protein [Hydrogenophaga sp. 2FB]